MKPAAGQARASNASVMRRHQVFPLEKFVADSVGGPHRGRSGTEAHSAPPDTVRHSHLWELGTPPQVLQSSTSNLDDPVRHSIQRLGIQLCMFDAFVNRSALPTNTAQ